jgi:RecB family endonuclease NucS
LVASLAISQKETSKQLSELRLSQKETDRQIKQTGKQLGELGNKWGTFTEGMAIESIKRILLEKFKIPTMFQRAAKKMNGESIEIDFFGYENSTVNTAVIVEVKSHLRDDSYRQIEETMTNFSKFFPDHANKKLYGIIACVHASDSIRNVLRKKGIYLAVLHDDIFELYPFQDFTPKDFNHA